MADGTDDGQGQSARRYFTRKKSKRAKPVELSDSSSECNDDSDSPSASNSASTHKSVVHSEHPTIECPVCLQTCMHPARLPCGHIFCFLCLKGIAQQSKRCAMCRQEISSDYLERPDLLEVPDQITHKEQEDEYQWFYEGRNGWWKFEERLCKDLEEVKSLGMDKLETLICGTLYVIDLNALVQYNKDNPTRRRRIKRDLVTNVVVKGWWQYDERTSRELEASYKGGIRTCELLIAGFLYTADFDSMVQMRRNEPHRRRRIKRDLATIPKKGVAGIRHLINVDSVLEQFSSLTISDNPIEG